MLVELGNAVERSLKRVWRAGWRTLLVKSMTRNDAPPLLAVAKGDELPGKGEAMSAKTQPPQAHFTDAYWLLSAMN